MDRLVHITGQYNQQKMEAQKMMSKQGYKKQRAASILLRTIWKAKQIKRNTKLRIFSSNVNAVSMDRRHGKVHRKH